MLITSCKLKEVKKLSPRMFNDQRGLFFESYREDLYRSLGVDVPFVQDNYSFSKKGTLRGMHFQSMPGQDKLLTVLIGTIYDVFVDIRKDSSTFGKWEAVTLKEGEQIFIPKGFAHGFYVLSDAAHITYKVSSLYHGETEKTFRHDDPQVGIIWPEGEERILSDKDRSAPFLHEVLA